MTNWETMNVEIMNSACVRRWLENFSRFNMKLQHMPGKLIPSDPFSRAPHIPEGTPSELDSIDFEPRYELPWPLNELQTDEFLEEKDPVGVVQHLINSHSGSTASTDSRITTINNMFPIVGEEVPTESSSAYDPDIIMGCQGDGGLECQCQWCNCCLLYTSPSPRDMRRSRMPSSA